MTSQTKSVATTATPAELRCSDCNGVGFVLSDEDVFPCPGCGFASDVTRPMPELIPGKRGGKWTFEPTAEDGQPATDLENKVMRSATSNSPMARRGRFHEMAHAQYTPRIKPDEAAKAHGVSVDALQVTEDCRIQVRSRQAGFDGFNERVVDEAAFSKAAAENMIDPVQLGHILMALGGTDDFDPVVRATHAACRAAGKPDHANACVVAMGCYDKVNAVDRPTFAQSIVNAEKLDKALGLLPKMPPMDLPPEQGEGEEGKGQQGQQRKGGSNDASENSDGESGSETEDGKGDGSNRGDDNDGNDGDSGDGSGEGDADDDKDGGSSKGESEQDGGNADGSEVRQGNLDGGDGDGDNAPRGETDQQDGDGEGDANGTGELGEGEAGAGEAKWDGEQGVATGHADGTHTEGAANLIDIDALTEGVYTEGEENHQYEGDGRGGQYLNASVIPDFLRPLFGLESKRDQERMERVSATKLRAEGVARKSRRSGGRPRRTPLSVECGRYFAYDAHTNTTVECDGKIAALRKSQAIRRANLKRADAIIARADGNETFQWGEVVIERVPLPNRIGGIWKRPKRNTTDSGCVPVAMHRLPIDSKVFAERVPKGASPTIMVDLSGSMSLSSAQVHALIHKHPYCTIATYSGYSTWGIIRIIAQGGWVADEKHCNAPADLANTIDGPALQYLSRLPQPRIWISDGGVHGGHHGYGRETENGDDDALEKLHTTGGYTAKGIDVHAHTRYLVSRYAIKQVISPEDAGAYLKELGRRGKLFLQKLRTKLESDSMPHKEIVRKSVRVDGKLVIRKVVKIVMRPIGRSIDSDFNKGAD